MKTALFTNFTNEEFIGYWNGVEKRFKAGESKYMSDSLARHFAKHLTNRELIRKDKNGNPLYKNGEESTSPKKPEDVPLFMNLFNKAYTPELSDDNDVVDQPEDEHLSMNIQSLNHKQPLPNASKKPNKIPVAKVEDNDDDESFEDNAQSDETTEPKQK